MIKTIKKRDFKESLKEELGKEMVLKWKQIEPSLLTCVVWTNISFIEYNHEKNVATTEKKGVAFLQA